MSGSKIRGLAVKLPCRQSDRVAGLKGYDPEGKQAHVAAASRRISEIEIGGAIAVQVEADGLIDTDLGISRRVDNLGFGGLCHCQYTYSRRACRQGIGVKVLLKRIRRVDGLPRRCWGFHNTPRLVRCADRCGHPRQARAD